MGFGKDLSPVEDARYISIRNLREQLSLSDITMQMT